MCDDYGARNSFMYYRPRPKVAEEGAARNWNEAAVRRDLNAFSDGNLDLLSSFLNGQLGFLSSLFSFKRGNGVPPPGLKHPRCRTHRPMASHASSKSSDMSEQTELSRTDLPPGSLGQQTDGYAAGISHLSLANGSKISPSSMPEVRVEVVSDESSDSGGQNKSISPVSTGSGPGSVKDDPWRDFQPPSEELKNRIIQQVEFYFSDDNIVKDAFLLKHIKRNKQGFVSLKLISSFKKVKSISKDWRQVAYSLKLSNKLEVNAENSKVRRTEPLPDKIFEEAPTKTVLAINLPFSNPTIEQLADLFGPCGEIALISILKPGKPLPQDIKSFANKHPEIGTTICGLVEFEKVESAKLACQKLSDSTNWRNGMRVIELIKAKAKKVKDTKQDAENIDSSSRFSENAESLENKSRKKKKQKNRNLESIVKEGECGNTTSGSEAENLPWRARSGSNLSVEGRSSPRQLTPQHSPRSSPRFQHRPRSGSYLTPDGSGDSKPVSRESSPDVRRKGDGSASSSPWVQRRRLLAAAGAGAVSNIQGSPLSSPLLGRKNPDGSINAVSLTRQPQAPDEVEPFYGGKGRGKLRSSTSPL